MPGPGRRFQPGQSGNPGGRPKAARGLPNRIRIATGDGLEVVEFHRNTMKDPSATYADRKVSADWLIYWGFGAEPYFDEEDETQGLPFGLTSLSLPDEDDE